MFRKRFEGLVEKMSPQKIPNKLPTSSTNRYRAGYTVYIETNLQKTHYQFH